MADVQEAKPSQTPEAPLAAKESKEMVVINDDYFKQHFRSGMEDIDSTDLIIPQLKIVQLNNNDTDANGNPFPRGKILYKGDNRVLDEVDVTFLAFAKKQLPSFSDKNIMNDTYVGMGAIHPDLAPFRIYFQGSSYGVAKAIFTDWVRSKRPIWTMKVRLQVDKKDGEKGVYYRYKYMVSGLLEPGKDNEMILRLQKLADKYGEHVKKEDVVEGEITEDDIPF